MDPVGASANGFKGVLYGGKHVISNVTFTNKNFNGKNQTGCFGYLVSTSIYDLGFASTCKLTTSTYLLCAGMLAASTNGSACNIVNVSVNCNISLASSVKDTSAVTQGSIYLGGLIGVGTTSFYKCVYVGTLTLTDTNGQAAAANVLDNGNFIGGLVAYGAVGAYACYVNVNSVFNSGGPNGGALNGNGGSITAEDCVIAHFASFTGNLNSPDAMSAGSYSASWNMKNCYITSNMPTTYSSATKYTMSNCYATYATGTSGGASASALPADAVTGLTQYANSAANGKIVMDKANTNTTVTSLYSISTGTSNNSGLTSAISKIAPGGTNAANVYNIYFAKGLGASGGPGTMTFTYKTGYQLRGLRGRPLVGNTIV